MNNCKLSGHSIKNTVKKNIPVSCQLDPEPQNYQVTPGTPKVGPRTDVDQNFCN